MGRGGWWTEGGQWTVDGGRRADSGRTVGSLLMTSGGLTMGTGYDLTKSDTRCMISVRACLTENIAWVSFDHIEVAPVDVSVGQGSVCKSRVIQDDSK